MSSSTSEDVDAVQQTPVKVVCWNVRNLSDQLVRKGDRGGVIPLRVRVSAVGAYIGKEAFDIAIILEAGPDAASIGEIIRERANASKQVGAYSYDCYPPRPNSDGETTLVVYNRRNTPNLDTRLIGVVPKPKAADGNYRGALLIQFHEFCIAALHAPSYGDIRFRVIQQAVEEASAIANGRPLVFIGDFNVKNTTAELGRLENIMKVNGLKFIGPSEDGGASPQCTSLKKYYNQIKVGYLEDAFVTNESYDQAWYAGPAPLVSECKADLQMTNFRLPANAGAKITGKLVQFDLKDYNPVIRHTKAADTLVTNDANGQALQGLYDQQLGRFNDLFQQFLEIHARFGEQEIALLTQDYANKIRRFQEQILPRPTTVRDCKNWTYFLKETNKKLEFLTAYFTKVIEGHSIETLEFE